MLQFFNNVFAYLFKNLGVIIGIAESILKAAGAIISFTPTKKDDAVYAVIDAWFSKIKGWLYTVSDKLAGKEGNIPNS